MANSMILSEKARSRPQVHTTIVFKAIGLLDVYELTQALLLLGVPDTEVPIKKGAWLACGLDSEGHIQLWPASLADL
jgi:hypothetical protein